MGRNAEAFMEQISYWWTNLASKKARYDFMDRMIKSWDRLDPAMAKRNRLRKSYWKKVEKKLLEGNTREAVEGIVAIAGRNVKAAKRFYTLKG